MIGIQFLNHVINEKIYRPWLILVTHFCIQVLSTRTLGHDIWKRTPLPYICECECVSVEAFAFIIIIKKRCVFISSLFYGISTLVGYLMRNPIFFTHIHKQTDRQTDTHTHTHTHTYIYIYILFSPDKPESGIIPSGQIHSTMDI